MASEAPYIPTFQLNRNYFFLHKTQATQTGFGLDHTPELIEAGFGIYSCVNLQDKVGPLRSDFYRIAFCSKGALQVDIGLESFTHQQNTIHFTIPEQLFVMKNKSADLEGYYLFFTPDFMESILPNIRLKATYPFFDYPGVPFFQLSDEEAKQVTTLFFEISREIQRSLADKERAIKLIINLLLIEAKRSYLRQGLHTVLKDSKNAQLVIRYKKLVAQHFIKTRNVQEYAKMLAVSPNHLSKLIKQETGKSPGVWIDEMLIMEIKALLIYSELNISEIAYQLDFTDSSHLAKFFKRYSGMTPLEYRKKFA